MISEIKEILRKAKDERPKNWRYGQAVFNYAHEQFPEETDILRGTINDCFNFDQDVTLFTDALQNLVAVTKIFKTNNNIE